MFFFLDYESSVTKPPSIQVVENDAHLSHVLPNTLYLQAGQQRLVQIPCPQGQLILLGDPIGECTDSLLQNIIPKVGILNENQLYANIKGHYNWFYLYPQGLQCGSAFGAIFPLYYTLRNKRVALSSSTFYLTEKLDIQQTDRRNLLERLLFNYPIFDSTWWEEVKRLPAHQRLTIEGNHQRVQGNFELSDYFGSPEQRSVRNLKDLSRFFAEEATAFFPDEEFGISFTGGFDGRTLVAAARQTNRSFFTYSFGRPDSTDLSLPAQQAKRLKIDYRPILLDDNYVQHQSLTAARNWMQLTEYNGNYGRPHYEYAARLLSKDTNYILTGNFGSELFRALHIAGVMMSENLIYYFACPDDSWKDQLRKQTESFDKNFFADALDSLIAELEQYRAKHQGWDTNHRFYDFVFNEIFRKYFGPELIMQSTYLRNRTPYLNLALFQRLNQTIWSGVHARLFEKWKTKRLKGQLFYSQFIREVDPKLYLLNTNKGYSPADVGEKWRWPLLLAKVVWKKYGPSKEIDDNATYAFFQNHYKALYQEIVKSKQSNLMSLSLKQSLSGLAKGEEVAYWIKQYSIAAGWQAAKSKKTATNKTHTHED